MILIFDIFGVVWRDNVLNLPLLRVAAEHRAGGGQVYFASNMNADDKEKFGPHLNEYGEAILCSGELGVAKPSPEFYHQVVKRIGAKPDQILFFDDSHTNVAAAKACGWQAFLYQDVADTRQLISESKT
jgi:FMN phosphatase YigB (HAD superfamily)